MTKFCLIYEKRREASLSEIDILDRYIGSNQNPPKYGSFMKSEILKNEEIGILRRP